MYVELDESPVLSIQTDEYTGISYGSDKNAGRKLVSGAERSYV